MYSPITNAKHRKAALTTDVRRLGNKTLSNTVNHPAPRFRDASTRVPTSIDRQRIRWAWSADGEWDVPSTARLHLPYLRSSELYKMYIVTPDLSRNDERTETDSAPIRTIVADVFAQYAGSLQAGR